MSATQNTIGNSQKNKIIEELIKVGCVKSKTKFDTYYKAPVVCIKKLSELLEEEKSSVYTDFNKTRMTVSFAKKLVNLLKNKYDINPKIKGL